ncbi:hypothetical protein DV096_12345 [Bradymonadaceae bacterium TMQ3]|uniref:Uncharacterized protein n=1 Tax=Lujinxingia sediminis TaxID=2480984 RepID=A0ABY0CQL1_9DELT|nr:hypothetical protein [Lujinxingia sediminis]RDV37893.1 hypothetical protein DV096_12345 [Bradymonadaceae bacterium TMQ3]RVU42777.1 hypothetical protein EA187_14805 [Lujinxingia sediminis]TXC75328.1 hypothetical protein FRC91_11435 [Bradymonadales bacterium TMQ1]
MPTLTEKLAQVDRQKVIKDAARLIENEVSSKSGLSGMAIKGGYKVVKKLKPTMIEESIDHLLDAFTGALDPLYQDYVENAALSTFEAYIQKHDDRAANDLLSITDAKAERSDNKILKSTYGKLRGQAEKHVKEALPGVGRLIDRYAPKDA